MKKSELKLIIRECIVEEGRLDGKSNPFYVTVDNWNSSKNGSGGGSGGPFNSSKLKKHLEWLEAQNIEHKNVILWQSVGVLPEKYWPKNKDK